MSYVLLKDSTPTGPTGIADSPSSTGNTGYGGPSGPTATSGPTPESLSNCTRIVISFWFRVPQSTIDKVKKQYELWKAEDKEVQDSGGYGVIPPPFNGIIPLLTFGEATDFKNVGTKGVPGGEFNFILHQWLGEFLGCRWDDRGVSPVTPVLFQSEFNGKFDYPTSPSYIGVDCKPLVGDEDKGIVAETLPKLMFAIQTKEKATVTGATNASLNQESAENTDVDVWNIVTPVDLSKCHPPGHNYGPSDSNFWLDPISSATTTITLEPGPLINEELFQTLPGPYLPEKSLKHSVPVSADHWHHVLLSFDLTFPCKVKGRMEKTYVRKPGTIESAPQLWIAFDGKNLIKKGLSHYWPQTGKPNDFISVTAKSIYDSNVYPSDNGLQHYNGGGTEHYLYVIGEKAGDYSYTFKPLNMLPVGLPSTDLYTDYIRHVEMAELQIFPGICIDTGVKEHRELFIHNGKPVPADQKATEGNKWQPGSIEFFSRVIGQEILPEVLLHKTKKWQKGENTGDGGQFEPVGKIDPYKPDPSLKGPQGDPQ